MFYWIVYFVGFTVTLILRCLGGEALLKWNAAVAFPWYDAETNTQYFPFKTLSMLIGLVVMLVVAYVTDRLMESGKMSTRPLRLINNRYGREQLTKGALSENNFDSVDDLSMEETKKMWWWIWFD